MTTSNHRRPPFCAALAIAFVASVVSGVLAAGCAASRPRDRWDDLLGPNECGPREDEDACRGCIRERCCEQLYACKGSASCICYFGCRLDASRSVCSFACNVRAVPAFHNELAACANEQCSSPCSGRSW